MKIGRIAVMAVGLTPLLLTVVFAATQALPLSTSGQQGDPFYKLLLAAFGLAITLIGFFLNRQLSQSDEDSRRQWEKLDNHESRISHIEGRYGDNAGGK